MGFQGMDCVGSQLLLDSACWKQKEGALSFWQAWRRKMLPGCVPHLVLSARCGGIVNTQDPEAWQDGAMIQSQGLACARP